MKPRHAVLALLAHVLLTSGALAQPATTEPDDSEFEALVAAVDAAHRGTTEARAFDRFRARLTIQRDVEEEGEVQTIDVRLLAMFLAPDLLHYEVEEAGRQLERGVDARGMWARNEDRVYPIQGREFATERQEVRRHVRLARQLLRFLDPAATLRTLRDRSPVEDRELQIGRLPARSCRYVEGVLDGFPMFTSAGEVQAVRLGVWTEAGLVAAVQATPIGEDGEVTGSAERVVLDDYQDYDGLAAPSHLTVYGIGEAPRQPELLAKIAITDLDLDPELDAESFARPEPR